MAMEKILGDYKIVVQNDDDAESPRTSYDNLTKMVCFHSKYSLGDEHDYNFDDYSSWNEMKKDIVKREDTAVILPLFLYDHSGVTISTSPFGCRWDSGQVGFVFLTKADLRKEYDVLYVTKKTREKALSVLNAEVEMYDKYLRGEVYWFQLWKGDELVDSCHGFYDEDECFEAAKECME